MGHLPAYLMSNLKRASVKKALIIGGMTGLLVSFLSGLMNPVLTILIGVVFYIGVERIVAIIWPSP